MAEKVFENVIFQQLFDTYENWWNQNPVLKEGVIAIATITAGDTQEVNSVAAPQMLIKIGDGTTDYQHLPFASARAADVYSWAKAKNKPVYEATEITGIGDYIAQYVDETLGISVDTDTQYRIVAGSDAYTYKLQSKAKGEADTAFKDISTITIPKYDDTQVKQDITDLKNLVGTTAVATQIGNAIAALKLAETYAAKEHEHVMADITDLDEKFQTVERNIDDNGQTLTTLVGSDTGKSARAIAEEVAASAVESAGHLKREIVTTLPEASAADPETIYMVKDTSVTSGDAYKEYMLISGELVQIGDTTVSLEGYATEGYADEAAADVKEELIGTDADDVNANTIKGAKKAADAAMSFAEDLSQSIQVHDVTAGTGLKVTKTGTTAKIDLDETVTFIFKSGNAQTAKAQESINS